MQLTAALVLGAVCSTVSREAEAFAIDTGSPDLAVRWDNTVRVNAAWRVEKIDDTLADNFLYDESDYKFDRGDMVTQRVDLLSEFDVVWRQHYGARVSAAGWYDYAYRNSDVKQNPALSELPSSYHDKQYSGLTDDFYHGPYGEVLDAFAFMDQRFGDVPVVVKAGQFTTFWGMSLFYPGGIAQDQHALDGRKGAANPGTETKELFLPLSQVNVQAQLSPAVAIEGQYYLDWANTRSPEGGTFLGRADMVLQGPQQLGGDPLQGANLQRRSPLKPSDQEGNWGVSLKYSPDFLYGQTLGFYYRQFDEKVPWMFVVTPASNQPKDLGYRAVYARNTKLAGVSFDGQIGQWAVGAEVGYHMGTGLKSVGFAIADEGARGDTWHALVNGLYLLDRGPLWDTGTAVIELTYDRLDSVTKNEDLFLREGNPTCTIGRGGPPGSWRDGCATRDAWGLNVRFAPEWLSVLPSLDVTLPITYQTGLDGNSAITALGVSEQATTVSVGVQLDYRVIHRLAITYDDYFAKRRTSNGVVVSGNGDYGVTDRGRVTITYSVAF
ncbi:MAG: DUF1302 family protein [Pseudomonadales bacterium]|nr:DUF1302 family protein [Pseudomonadales bacterium]